MTKSKTFRLYTIKISSNDKLSLELLLITDKQILTILCHALDYSHCNK